MKAYSKDLRQRVFADCDAGWRSARWRASTRSAESWIRRLRQRRRENNETAPRIRRSRPPLWLPLKDKIKRLVTEKPDLTLNELQRYT